MAAFLAAKNGVYDAQILVWSLITTLFLQVLSNLANDYGDAQSGVDGEHREGPERTVSSGLISKKAMKNALIVFSILSLLSGVYLIVIAFGEDWLKAGIFLILGLGAIAAAIKYTVGKNPYGYAGMGDFFVLVFFGFVGVAGSYYLYAHTLNWMIMLPTLSTGLLSVGVLNVNNIRDIESDRASGKLSIPVRIGRENAVIYHWGILLASLIASLIYVNMSDVGWQGYLFLLVTPFWFLNARAVKIKTTPRSLDPYLKQLALSTLLYVLLFGSGLILF